MIVVRNSHHRFGHVSNDFRSEGQWGWRREGSSNDVTPHYVTGQSSLKGITKPCDAERNRDSIQAFREIPANQIQAPSVCLSLVARLTIAPSTANPRLAVSSLFVAAPSRLEASNDISARTVTVGLVATARCNRHITLGERAASRKRAPSGLAPPRKLTLSSQLRLPSSPRHPDQSRHRAMGFDGQYRFTTGHQHRPGLTVDSAFQRDWRVREYARTNKGATTSTLPSSSNSFAFHRRRSHVKLNTRSATRTLFASVLPRSHAHPVSSPKAIRRFTRYHVTAPSSVHIAYKPHPPPWWRRRPATWPSARFFFFARQPRPEASPPLTLVDRAVLCSLVGRLPICFHVSHTPSLQRRGFVTVSAQSPDSVWRQGWAVARHVIRNQHDRLQSAYQRRRWRR